MKNSKPWYQSRTLWLSIAQGIAGALVVIILKHPDLGFAIILKAFIDGILRYNTTTVIN